MHLKFEKPWENFDKDVLQAVQYIIPKHFVDDNSLRQSKKVLRDRDGKAIIKDGHKVYIKGNTARGSFHKDTFYGCIMTPPEKALKDIRFLCRGFPAIHFQKIWQIKL